MRTNNTLIAVQLDIKHLYHQRLAYIGCESQMLSVQAASGHLCEATCYAPRFPPAICFPLIATNRHIYKPFMII